MGFAEFIGYVKKAGEKVLTYFPSKTDLISVVDSNGNVTDELLSERLQKMNNGVQLTNSHTIGVFIDSATKKEVLNQNGIIIILDGSNMQKSDVFFKTTLSFYDDDVTSDCNEDYIIPQGTIVLITENYIDAPQGVYVCKKDFVLSAYLGYFDVIGVDYCTNSELFEHISENEWIDAGTKVEVSLTYLMMLNILNGAVTPLHEVQDNIGCYSKAPINLKDSTSDIQSLFNYAGEANSSVFMASGSSPTKYLYLVNQNFLSKIVYISSDISISSGLFLTSGAVPSFLLKAGYYYFGSSTVSKMVLNDSASAVTESKSYKYYGTNFNVLVNGE